MTKATNQPDLDAIEQRANAATPGPWCTDDWEIYQGTEYQPGLSLWIGETCRGTTSPEQDRADAAFVAAARTDVPALVAEIRRLRAELAAAQSGALLLAAARLEAACPDSGAEERFALCQCDAADELRALAAGVVVSAASEETAR